MYIDIADSHGEQNFKGKAYLQKRAANVLRKTG